MRLRQMYVKIGLCALNNDALDFKRNYEKIVQSIEQCKKMGCSIRIGAQLEVPGYACNDHFLEYDTIFHSWDVVHDILASGVTTGIVAEVGCPILHNAAMYNGRVILHNNKIVAIRVKTILADGSNYFETRYYSSWKHKRDVGQYMLPQAIQKLTGQRTCPIGVFIIEFNDTSLAYQICEQAWISNNPMIDAALDGAQIFVNSSASECERGKLKRKLQMIEEFTQRHGGAYAYVNTKGMQGDRNYMDGGCFFSQNGKIKQLSQPFRLGDIQITPITINLNSIRTFRINNKSFQKQSHGVIMIPRVKIDVNIAVNEEEYVYDGALHKDELQRRRQLFEFPHATFEPSIYLWDYLRKCGARGFYLSLSGGLDSCAAVLTVYNMCHLVYDAIVNNKDADQVLSDLRKVLRKKNYYPKSPKKLCNDLLYTAYLATVNSSELTMQRAKRIAQDFGCKHRVVNFDDIFTSYQNISSKQLGIDLKYMRDGGSFGMDKALQNVQARTRMVLGYFLAAVELEKENAKDGYLLVLGSSNLDEALRGYFTKYDSSSSDVNPIGSFSKVRLRQFLGYFYQMYKLESIREVLEAVPTAQLRPLAEGQVVQTDEEDMGLTYAELCIFGRLRRIQRLGPVSMFDRLHNKRAYENVHELADKIKHFFVTYSQNRHKVTTLPPTFHFDPEACDDNRLDMRPIIYATDWSYQFELIDQRVREIKAKEAKDVKPTQRRKLARTDSIIQPELMMKNIAPTHSIVHKYSEGKKGGLQNISEDTGEQEHEEAEAEGEI